MTDTQRTREAAMRLTRAAFDALPAGQVGAIAQAFGTSGRIYCLADRARVWRAIQNHKVYGTPQSEKSIMNILKASVASLAFQKFREGTTIPGVEHYSILQPDVPSDTTMVLSVWPVKDGQPRYFTVKVTENQ